MKPKKGDQSSEMEELAKDPLQLVKELVLLIVEARTPDLSAKGRVEGPHCPIIRGRPAHKCNAEKVECLRASEFCHLAHKLWTNRIPICLDILLFPDCPHGWEETRMMEGTASVVSTENAMLVERWCIESQRTRQDEGLGSTLLVQAVRSFLHFSQISSWLHSNKGKLPVLLAYRLYAPGEEAGVDFTDYPERHTFPVCSASHYKVKVSVSAMQRQSTVPALLCATRLRKTSAQESQKLDKMVQQSAHHRDESGSFASSNQSCRRETEKGAKGREDVRKEEQSQLETSVVGVKLGEEHVSGLVGVPKDLETGAKGSQESKKKESQDLKKWKGSGKLGREKYEGDSDLAKFEFGNGHLVEKKYGKKSGSPLKPGESHDLGHSGMQLGRDGENQATKGRNRQRKKDAEKDLRIEQMKSELKQSMAISSIHAGFVEEDRKREEFSKKYRDRKGGIEMDSDWELRKLGHQLGVDLDSDETMDRQRVYKEKKKDREKIERSVKEEAAEMERRERRKSDIAQKEALEEEFIRKLSDRLSLLDPTADSKTTESRFRHGDQYLLQETNHGKIKSSLDSTLTDMEKVSYSAARSGSPLDASLSSQISQLTIDVDFDSGSSTPVASPNNTLRRSKRGLGESLERSLADRHLKQSVLAASSNNFSDASTQDTYEGASLHRTSPNEYENGFFKSEDRQEATNGFSKVTKENSSHVNFSHERNVTAEVSQSNLSKNVMSDECAKTKGVGMMSEGPFENNQVGEKIYQAVMKSEGDIDDVDKANFEKTEREYANGSHLYQQLVDAVRGDPQHNKRKVFEERLLPLMSYDAQTDSFRQVETSAANSQVLHSPKVLFSYDVLAERSSERQRSIDFSQALESEFFTTKLHEVLDPESIGRYMSRMAELSTQSQNISLDYDSSGEGKSGLIKAGKAGEDLPGGHSDDEGEVKTENLCKTVEIKNDSKTKAESNLSSVMQNDRTKHRLSDKEELSNGANCNVNAIQSQPSYATTSRRQLVYTTQKNEVGRPDDQNSKQTRKSHSLSLKISSDKVVQGISGSSDLCPKNFHSTESNSQASPLVPPKDVIALEFLKLSSGSPQSPMLSSSSSSSSSSSTSSWSSVLSGSQNSSSLVSSGFTTGLSGLSETPTEKSSETSNGWRPFMGLCQNGAAKDSLSGLSVAENGAEMNSVKLPRSESDLRDGAGRSQNGVLLVSGLSGNEKTENLSQISGELTSVTNLSECDYQTATSSSLNGFSSSGPSDLSCESDSPTKVSDGSSESSNGWVAVTEYSRVVLPSAILPDSSMHLESFSEKTSQHVQIKSSVTQSVTNFDNSVSCATQSTKQFPRLCDNSISGQTILSTEVIDSQFKSASVEVKNSEGSIRLPSLTKPSINSESATSLDSNSAHTPSIQSLSEISSSDLAKNSSDLAKNSSDLARNSLDLPKNSSDLARNSSDLARNSSDLAKNSEAQEKGPSQTSQEQQLEKKNLVDGQTTDTFKKQSFYSDGEKIPLSSKLSVIQSIPSQIGSLMPQGTLTYAHQQESTLLPESISKPLALKREIAEGINVAGNDSSSLNSQALGSSLTAVLSASSLSSSSSSSSSSLTAASIEHSSHDPFAVDEAMTIDVPSLNSPSLSVALPETMHPLMSSEMVTSSPHPPKTSTPHTSSTTSMTFSPPSLPPRPLDAPTDPQSLSEVIGHDLPTQRLLDLHMESANLDLGTLPQVQCGFGSHPLISAVSAAGDVLPTPPSKAPCDQQLVLNNGSIAQSNFQQNSVATKELDTPIIGLVQPENKHGLSQSSTIEGSQAAGPATAESDMTISDVSNVSSEEDSFKSVQRQKLTQKPLPYHSAFATDNGKNVQPAALSTLSNNVSLPAKNSTLTSTDTFSKGEGATQSFSNQLDDATRPSGKTRSRKHGHERKKEGEYDDIVFFLTDDEDDNNDASEKKKRKETGAPSLEKDADKTASPSSLLSMSVSKSTNQSSESCGPPAAEVRSRSGFPRSMSLSADSPDSDVASLDSQLGSQPSDDISLRLGVKSSVDVKMKENKSPGPGIYNGALNGGWSSAPPHRTVSTPSGMDRDVKVRGQGSETSVMQKQSCDNWSSVNLRKTAVRSASMIFNSRTGLPSQSSPAPLKRRSGGRFDYDASLLNTKAIKSAFSCSKLSRGEDGDEENDRQRTLSTSAPASTNCLLGNFEESILNGRIDPVGTVDGFTAEIGASGTFCPKHLRTPVSAFFFALSDDNAPSPYLGHINLETVSKKGYHIPRKGTVQVTLFNPNQTVVKMFVVAYDLSDMPSSSQTFIRQRTVYRPVDRNSMAPAYLRYLIHLRCWSSRSGKVYLHTDIRLIFARHRLEIDAKTVPYELKSYTEGPQNPKYSPKK